MSDQWPPYNYDFSWQSNAPREPKKLAEIKTLDEIPSPTPPITEYIGDAGDVLCILPVHGLGVITLRAHVDDSDPETGRLRAHGVGIFTTDEIRPPVRSERDALR